MPGAPDPTLQNGSAYEGRRVDAKISTIVVRPYRDEDFHDVRRILVEGTTHGSGSPASGGFAYLSKYLHRAYMAFATGFVGLSAASLDSTRHVVLAIGVQPQWLKWCSSAVCATSMLAAGILWYNRRKIGGIVNEWLQRALDKDMNDIAGTYKLHKNDDGKEYEMSGPTGFWVAVDGDKVVGEVGLINPVKGDETTGEVSRLNVSPQYRKRGVGKMLMNTVIAHGRAKGLGSLWLSTSSFHTAAVNMYQKNGWKLELTRTVRIGGIVASTVVNFRMLLR